MSSLVGALVKKAAAFIHCKYQFGLNAVFFNDFLKKFIPVVYSVFINCSTTHLFKESNVK